MVGKITKDNRLSFFLTLLFCLLCVGTAYRHTSMIVEVLLLLVLGIAWFLMPKIPSPLQKNEKLFIVALFFFFCSALLSYVAGSGWELKSIRNPSMPSFIDLDLPSKYLLGALVFFLVSKLDFKICKKALFYSIALGGIINGCIAIYERYVLGIGRIDGWSGIAEMADASAMLGIFSLIFFIFATSGRERLFYFFASFMACFASILTGTRGAMLGIILTLAFIGILIFWKRRELFRLFMVGVLSCVISFLCSYSFQGGVQDALRINAGVNDIETYAKEKNIAISSLGSRFDMWKEAIVMFQMAPIFGLSGAEIKEKMLEILQKSGSRLLRVQSDNDARGNKHNQILNQAAKRGIVGVFAILFVWFASFKLFYAFFKENFLMLPMCGMSIVFYLIFPNSFSGEPWESNVVFPLATLFVCAFWKMIEMEKNAKD